MDFNLKKSIIALSSFIVISAYAATIESKIEITTQDLQYRNWELTSIDGKELLPSGFGTPNIEIGANMHANGHLGCNRFMGQMLLKDQQAMINHMGSTMMMCPPEQMKIERQMTSVLNNWSHISITTNQLILKSNGTELTFTLKDFMQ